jgi:Small protein A (tmRNA-binding)
MNTLKYLVYLLFLISMLGCGSRLLTVHKIDVQQGNALDAEMIDKIEIGMTQEQVHFVLGSPLIIDSFHPERWDYIFLFTPGYGEQERRQLTLTFDRDELINIDKHNIAKSNIISDDNNDAEQKARNRNKKLEENKKELEEKLSEKDEEELKDLEKQASDLEETLETNKDPGEL